MSVTIMGYQGYQSYQGYLANPHKGKRKRMRMCIYVRMCMRMCMCASGKRLLGLLMRMIRIIRVSIDL